MSRELPDIIKEVGFDFSWDERKVWELNVPTEDMSIDELTWHFDIPFIWSKPDGYYDVKPMRLLTIPNNIQKHTNEQCDRIQHIQLTSCFGNSAGLF